MRKKISFLPSVLIVFLFIYLFLPLRLKAENSSIDINSLQWAVSLSSECNLPSKTGGLVLCENFYALGFSTSGTFALLKKVNQSQCDCKPFHFIVLDLKRNTIIADVDFSSRTNREKPFSDFLGKLESKFLIQPRNDLTVVPFPNESPTGILSSRLENAQTNRRRLLFISNHNESSIIAEGGNRNLNNIDRLVGGIFNPMARECVIVTQGRRKINKNDEEIFQSLFGVVGW